MTEQDTIFRRFVSEILAGCDRVAAAEILGEPFEDHDPMPMQQPGAEGLLAAAELTNAAMPDLRYEVMLVVPDASRVAGRWRLTGTNSGSLWGHPPTGGSVEVTGVDVLRLQDGRVMERWSKWERHVLLKQLGMPPSPPSQGA
jgi:predicted ester cyclase